MIQNAAARLVFSEPKRAHVTPLFVSLHWLPVVARIKFKTLVLAYRTATGSEPIYFHPLMTIYIPSRSLRSASERRLVVPSQRVTKSLQNVFIHRSWLMEWTSHPYPEYWVPDNSQATLLSIFHHPSSLDKKPVLSLTLLSFLILSMSSLHAWNNAWNFVVQALPVSVCLFIMYCLLYSSIVCRFG